MTHLHRGPFLYLFPQYKSNKVNMTGGGKVETQTVNRLSIVFVKLTLQLTRVYRMYRL